MMPSLFTPRASINIKNVITTIVVMMAMEVMQVQAVPTFEGDVLDSLLNNTDSKVTTVYTSTLGTMISRTTSFISSLSSAMIILVILRSGNKLSTTYHRIMFGMSLSDIFGSMAIFFSSWLMPSDMIYKQFESKPWGTSATCTAQGFFFLNGMICSFGFNMTLCVYYVCIIKYKFSEEKFQKRAEPILFFLCAFIPLSLTMPLVFADKFAPTPWDFVCTEVRYPWWCKNGGGGDDLEEVCPPSPTFIAFKYSLLTVYVAAILVIIITMYLVVTSVYLQERTFDRYMKLVQTRRVINKEDKDSQDKLKTSHHLVNETRTVLSQAILFLAALLTCQLFPLMCLLKILHTNVIYQYFHVVLRPLQGFFNFLIFIGHKVSNRRRSNGNLTKWQAFCEVFLFPKEEPTLFVGNVNIVFKLHKVPGLDDDDEDEDVIDQGEGEGENNVMSMDISYSAGMKSLWSRNPDLSEASPKGVSFGPTYQGDSSSYAMKTNSGLSLEMSSRGNTTRGGDMSYGESFKDDDLSAMDPGSSSRRSRTSGVSAWNSSRQSRSKAPSSWANSSRQSGAAELSWNSRLSPTNSGDQDESIQSDDKLLLHNYPKR